MNEYESVLIFKDDCTPNDIDIVINKIRKDIDGNGKVTLVKYLGNKELAYEVKRYRKAHYYQIDFTTNAENISEITRIYRITEEILKFIIIKKDNTERK